MSSVGVVSTDLSIKQFSTFSAKISNISCHIENFQPKSIVLLKYCFRSPERFKNATDLKKSFLNSVFL